jgi:hypothetical protein
MKNALGRVSSHVRTRSEIIFDNQTDPVFQCGDLVLIGRGKPAHRNDAPAVFRVQLLDTLPALAAEPNRVRETALDQLRPAAVAELAEFVEIEREPWNSIRRSARKLSDFYVGSAGTMTRIEYAEIVPVSKATKQTEIKESRARRFMTESGWK